MTSLLAMAWVVRNPRISSAIMGASKVEQVHEAVRSLELLPKLTPEIMDEIDKVLGNKPEALVQRY
jgi:aryl-alcohol dehydrogenase-like predicted oxidoreductase